MGTQAAADSASRHDPAPVDREQRFVRRIIAAGWGCIAMSALFLFLSNPVPGTTEGGSDVLWALYLMLARFFGIASFAIGGVAIFKQRWTMGIVICLISVILPFLAYGMHGTF